MALAIALKAAAAASFRTRDTKGIASNEEAYLRNVVASVLSNKPARALHRHPYFASCFPKALASLFPCTSGTQMVDDR